MSQVAASGSKKLADVLSTTDVKWDPRNIFLIQAPTDNHKFLKFDGHSGTDSGDTARATWEYLPTTGSKDDNNKLLSKFLMFGSYKDDNSPPWACLSLLPGNGHSEYPYIIDRDEKGPVYWHKNEPGWWGGNNNDRFDVAGSDGVLKFRNGNYFRRDGAAKATEGSALKCRFLKVSDLTVGNFKIGDVQAEGTATTVDFVQAIKSSEDITSDYSSKGGPCPYNMISTNMDGKSEDCAEYFGVDNRFTLMDGKKGDLAPGADVVLPETTISFLKDKYSVVEADGNKFNFRVFYFMTTETSTDVLKRYLDKGGNVNAKGTQRAKMYEPLAARVCSYPDNVLHEFTYDGAGTDCSKVANDEENVIVTCISEEAKRMVDGKVCSNSNMGSERWQKAADRYCSVKDNQANDDRCKMYLVQNIANAEGVCGESTNEWCTDIATAKVKANKAYKKDKKDGTVLTGVTKKAYINDVLLREFYAKWQADHVNWKPDGFVLPNISFCLQQLKMREQNAAVDASCEIVNNTTNITGGTTDITGADPDSDSAELNVNKVRRRERRRLRSSSDPDLDEVDSDSDKKKNGVPPVAVGMSTPQKAVIACIGMCTVLMFFGILAFVAYSMRG